MPNINRLSSAGWRRSAGHGLGLSIGAALAGCAAVLLAAAAAEAEPAAKAKVVTAAPEPAKKAEPQRPLIPKPASPSKEEQEHMARLDKAIAPASTYKVSAEDAATVKEAIKAVYAHDLAKADQLKSKLSDAAGKKLIDWYRLRSGYGEAAEYRAFLAANPAWPDRTLLTQRLEEALFIQGGSAATIKSYFKDGPPATSVGLAALASAYLAEGNKDEATKLAARAWREDGLPVTLETGFLARFGSLLTPADHKWRLDRLILDDPRWSGDRNARASVARRVIPLLPHGEQKKAHARLAVFLKSSGGKKLIDALPAQSTPDWGLVFHRIQALRRAGHGSEAAQLLLGAPTEEAKIVVPDAWWEERQANAYAALKLGKSKLAYDLVREAGPLSVNPLKEQTFMAGWLALRYLRDPALAEPHFAAMLKAADGPLSRAKANYWLGRTAEARKDSAAAETYYKAAAEDPDTFHGLLARQKLEPGQQSIPIKAPAEPTVDDIERFNGLDAVKAVVIARQAGLDAHIIRVFIVHLRSVLPSEAGVAMVAHLSEALGDTQMAVRTGKAGISNRQNMLYYAYPVHTFPAYSPLRKPPETAFLLGIARQETEFNTLTVSGAGAKGLLQVMTVTANHVCRDYRIKCDIKRLLSDPAYNATLASAYVGDRMEEFRGSYVLTLAGYNAGPGRARQWIAEFGDPRDPKIDPIDWIERIPIQETREYVAKVLANVQVYRARLGEDKSALRLGEDLLRARVTSTPAAKEAKTDG